MFLFSILIMYVRYIIDFFSTLKYALLIYKSHAYKTMYVFGETLFEVIFKFKLKILSNEVTNLKKPSRLVEESLETKPLYSSH